MDEGGGDAGPAAMRQMSPAAPQMQSRAAPRRWRIVSLPAAWKAIERVTAADETAQRPVACQYAAL